MILMISVLLSMAFYLLLSKNLVKIIFSVIIFSSVINLIIYICGRADNGSPAFIGRSAPSLMSNPLPQALILTAIVIGFALLCYLCFLLIYIKREE